jgi:prefoldin subunit 5
MDAREARMEVGAGQLSAEQLLQRLQRPERLIHHLHAEIQRLKQRLAQYEPQTS